MAQKESLSDALAAANTAKPTGNRLPRGRCPECGADVPLRKDGVTREHRRTTKAKTVPHVCPGSGKAAVDEEAGETAPPAPARKGETKAGMRARLEAAGHVLVRTGGRLAEGGRHSIDCPACSSVADTRPTVDGPVFIEPSLEQQRLADQLPAGAWLGAKAEALDPHIIDPDPENARRDLGDLTELAASLITLGMVEPVIVIPLDGGRYRLVAGHRRVAASMLAGMPEVPAIVRRDLVLDPKATDTDAAARLAATQAAENMHRRDLTPVEEAANFKRLSGLGWTQERIAAAVGVNQGHVSKRLSLLKLTPEVQALVGDTISVEDAVELARLPKGAQAIAAKYLTSDNPRNAIARAKGEHERETARDAVVDRLAKEGVNVIPWPGYRWDYDDGVPLAVGGMRPGQVYFAAGVVDQTPAEHAKCPGHLATIVQEQGVYTTPVVLYLCSDPARHGIPTPDEHRDAIKADQDARVAELEAERAALAVALEGRRAAAITVAGGKVSRPAMGDFIAGGVLLGMQDELWLVPGCETEDAIATLTALGIDFTSPDYADMSVPGDAEMEAVEAAVAAAVEQVGTLRFAFAASVMAMCEGLSRPHVARMRVAGNPTIRAFFDLLTTHAGYALTDDDQGWLVPPAHWEPAPMPDEVPEGAVAWYAGNPDHEDDEARWLEEDEAEAIDALYPKRVYFVTAPETMPGNGAGLAEETVELVPGGTCPGSGRNYASSPASASAFPCPECGSAVATDGKGVVGSHVVPEAVAV